MNEETLEEKVQKAKEKILPVWDQATPDTSLVNFAIEWDHEYEELYRSSGWGFFSADKPRHLDHKTREMIVCALLAFRDRPGAYQHAKNALRQGATINELMEVFSVAVFPGGGPTRVVGLEGLRKIVQEEDGHTPLERAPKTDSEKDEDYSNESREEKVDRITKKIHADMGYEDENISFGVELDPDFFEVYSKVYWGFFEQERCHLDPIVREMVLLVVMTFRGLREEAYQHAKKALRLGATINQLLECHEVCIPPAGLGQLHEGLRTLRIISEEMTNES